MVAVGGGAWGQAEAVGRRALEGRAGGQVDGRAGPWLGVRACGRACVREGSAGRVLSRGCLPRRRLGDSTGGR
jgi:hypothetical protein